MGKYPFLVISAILGVLIVTGCAHVISEELRGQVTPELTFKEVIRDPVKYKGEMVLWGGVIISSTNTKEGTLIEVLEKPLGIRGQPKDVDVSEGRFLILHPEYLDCRIYGKGRKITVVGEISGQKTLALDEIDYTYPLISAKEMHLWKRERAYWAGPGWRFHFGLGFYHQL